MSTAKMDISLFHRFIQSSAQKPASCAMFPEFSFMEQQIRRNFKQVKKATISQLPCDEFEDYWKQISRQEQVYCYIRWVDSLVRAANKQEMVENRLDKEGQLYVRKSIISKWEKCRVKLSHLQLMLFGKKFKEYPLEYFCIRKSKNKEHFSFVLEPALHKPKATLKSVHIGSNNILQFQQWYMEIEKRIDNARTLFFRDKIKTESGGGSGSGVKTLTELVIDNEMKNIDDCEELEIVEQAPEHHELHPNIFRKFFPSLLPASFSLLPSGNFNLLHSSPGCKLYELLSDKQPILKVYFELKAGKREVFTALTQQQYAWNGQIDLVSVKTKISSQNSAIIYEKDKPQGFLYRQRDYFFLRHCFCLPSLPTHTFIIQKSIDSLLHPPFMTVARGEKHLIYCLAPGRNGSESFLTIQGWIKGGGYMKPSEDRDMTIKWMRKIAAVADYAKGRNKQAIIGGIFKQEWIVEDGGVSNANQSQEHNQNQFEQQFYSPKQLDEDNDEDLKEFRSSKEFQDKPKFSKQKQFLEFIKKTSSQQIQSNTQPNKQSSPNNSLEVLPFDYTPPSFNSDRSVAIPNSYLKTAHSLFPRTKSKKPMFFPQYRGHHLWKGEWQINEAGGLNYVDQEKMNEQKKVLTFIIKRIGRNILSGKGILNISLPVDIFCRESNIQRLAMSFGYCPTFLQRAAQLSKPSEQMKWVIASGISSSLIYLTMEKPFNPILGETYQCWLDDCPIYFEQISHHPPVASYFMQGRGYRITGSVEAKMELSINSGTGVNQGAFTVQFEKGGKFCFTTAPGELSGLTYGERKLIFVQKTYYWSIEHGLFLELQYDPATKNKKFFGGPTYVGDEKLRDYFEGVLKVYNPAQLAEFLSKKGSPKSLPPFEPIEQLYKVHGRWTKYVMADSQRVFDVDTDKYFKQTDEPNPLPSHSNYREDVVYRRLNNFVLSQQFKQILQIRQRRDRKLREEGDKKRLNK